MTLFTFVSRFTDTTERRVSQAWQEHFLALHTHRTFMNETRVLQGCRLRAVCSVECSRTFQRVFFSMNLCSLDLSRNIFVLVSFYPSRNLKNKKTPKFLLRRSFINRAALHFSSFRPPMVARNLIKKAFDSAFALWMIIQNVKRWLTIRPNENSFIKRSQESTIG